MSAPTLIERGRAAGAAGVSWQQFTFDLDEDVADPDAVEAAWLEGRRAHRLKTWSAWWTTAPEDYDACGTETIERSEHRSKVLRRVLIDPMHVDYQLARYGSGACGAWEEDPRVTDARIAEQIARERAEREERASRREAGLKWLLALDDVALEGADEDAFDAELHSRGLRWNDARDERKRRAARKEAEERAAAWARCQAAVPDGATLVDDGAPGSTEYIGSTPYRVPGREPKLWHGVRVVPHHTVADDADEARVVVRTWGKCSAVDDFVGSLAHVAERLEKGELRIAREDEKLPPRAVIERLRCTWKEVLCVEVGGSAVWVGSPQFSYDVLVLDDAGAIVRKKAVREAAIGEYLARRHGGGS